MRQYRTRMALADAQTPDCAVYLESGSPRGAPGGKSVSGTLVQAAPVMAVVAAMIYCCNGELMQALQKPGAASVSPLLNLVICHVGGLVFAPFVVRSPPVSIVQLRRGSVPLASFFFSVAIMGYNYAWMKSAQFIPTGLTNTVFQSSIFLVYVMSVCLFAEPVTPLRVGGVALALTGAAMASGMGISDFKVGVHGRLGIGVCLAAIAAIGFAVYQVLFRLVYGHLKSDPTFLMYFGAWVGVSHIVAILPMVFLADSLGLEKQTFPAGASAIIGTGLTAFAATVVNALNLCVVMWGSPMLLPIGSALSIPMTLLLDLLLHGIHPAPLEISGCVMLSFAFVLLVMRDAPGKPRKDGTQAEI